MDYDYVVAQDGSGDFSTFREAFDHINAKGQSWWWRLWHFVFRVRVHIAPGAYRGGGFLAIEFSSWPRPRIAIDGARVRPETTTAKLRELLSLFGDESWSVGYPHYSGTTDLVVYDGFGDAIVTVPGDAAQIMALAPDLARLVLTLTTNLETEWFSNHAEHCRNDWPHDGECQWPRAPGFAAVEELEL